MANYSGANSNSPSAVWISILREASVSLPQGISERSMSTEAERIPLVFSPPASFHGLNSDFGLPRVTVERDPLARSLTPVGRGAVANSQTQTDTTTGRTRICSRDLWTHICHAAASNSAVPYGDDGQQCIRRYERRSHFSRIGNHSRRSAMLLWAMSTDPAARLTLKNVRSAAPRVPSPPDSHLVRVSGIWTLESLRPSPSSGWFRRSSEELSRGQRRLCRCLSLMRDCRYEVSGRSSS